VVSYQPSAISRQLSAVSEAEKLAADSQGSVKKQLPAFATSYPFSRRRHVGAATGGAITDVPSPAKPSRPRACYFALFVFCFVRAGPLLSCFCRCANFVAGIRTILLVFRELPLFLLIAHRQTEN